MACNTYTLKGLARGCKDSIGGITKVWLSSDYDEVISDVSVDTTTNTLNVSSEAVNKFKVYNFFKNTGSMTSTLQVSDNAGNSFQTELALVFMKMETSKRLEVLAMCMQETCAIVKDRNSHYWFLGKDAGITASAGTGETGTASGDLNGYNVTLLDESIDLPYEITNETTIAALEAITVV